MAAFPRPSMRPLAAMASFLVEMSGLFTSFYGPVDIVLLVLFSVGQHTNFLRLLLAATTLWNPCKLSAGICLLAAFATQLSRAVRARSNTQQWDGPGKVLLFPSQTSHTRLFPQKHAFTYSYLTVGIPVGFHGNAGGMVSVDTPGALGRRRPWFFPPVSSPSRGWFTVDAGDYLARGNSELGLRGKLDAYLRSQGVAEPECYPHAYLLTAPRFFGYHFNPVSFWYLYDAGWRLAAMIVEVNNTFDERRMYFLAGYSTAEEQTGCCSQTDKPRQHVFKHSWPKDFHVSPFNSRRGSYTLTTTDPLASPSRPRISITLHSSSSRPKLVASLAPTSAAVDPTALTSPQKLRFLAAWWWVGFLTYPRILREAARLFFLRRGLRVWFRPEPLRGTIGRRATATERRLEAIFKRFLQHLVERAEKPLVVRYIPAGVVDSAAEVVLRSPAAATATEPDTGVDDDELEIRVLTPVFYANCAASPDSCWSFAHGNTTTTGTVYISRPDLLATLFHTKQTHFPIMLKDPYFTLIHLLRRRRPRRLSTSGTTTTPGGTIPRDATPEAVAPRNGIPKGITPSTKAQPATTTTPHLIRPLSPLDVYVLEHEPRRARAAYGGCVAKLLAADRFALGRVGAVEGLALLARVWGAWVLAGEVGRVAVLRTWVGVGGWGVWWWCL